MTTYWLYVDDPTNWARIHIGSCRYCNHGKGVKATRLPYNRWFGPFTLEKAVEEARRENKRNTKGCGGCLPRLRIN